MKSIREILDEKIMGIDCTEEESAEIKGYFRQHWDNPNSIFLALMQYFPEEYGEIEEEEE